MTDVVNADALALARRARGYLGRYRQSADLIAMGAYQAGSDPRLDEAIAHHDALERFLAQDLREAAPLAQSLAGLRKALENKA
jgi:flagellum-specific ATP synthase